MGIKFFISISRLLMPFFLGVSAGIPPESVSIMQTCYSAGTMAALVVFINARYGTLLKYAGASKWTNQNIICSGSFCRTGAEEPGDLQYKLQEELE